MSEETVDGRIPQMIDILALEGHVTYLLAEVKALKIELDKEQQYATSLHAKYNELLAARAEQRQHDADMGAKITMLTQMLQSLREIVDMRFENLKADIDKDSNGMLLRIIKLEHSERS